MSGNQNREYGRQILHFYRFRKRSRFLPVLLYKLMLSRYFTQDRKLIASRRECELIINHRYSIIAK